MEIFFIVMIVLVLILLIIASIKNDVTLDCRLRIIGAIHLYATNQNKKNEPIDVWYTDMESYDKTYYRWWDFGCTRILPPDKFEIIKPYLKKENKK